VELKLDLDIRDLAQSLWRHGVL